MTGLISENFDGDMLIGESTWDLICYEEQIGSCSEFFLHNDFFSRKSHVKYNLTRRVKILFKVFSISIRKVIQKRSICYSSLNSEVMLISLIFSVYKKSNLFIPNVIGNPKNYNLIFRANLWRYKNRIIISDVVSQKMLAESMPTMGRTIFDFACPPRDVVDHLTYIVVLPAAFSHKSTSSLAQSYYKFALDVASRLLSNGFRVYLLGHPRDKIYFSKMKFDCPTIRADEIVSFGENVCYVSGASSLSLNRRYGGRYGVWVSVDGINALPDSLLSLSQELVDINYFGKPTY